MQLSAYCSLAAALFCALVIRDIDCNPTHLVTNPKKESFKVQDSLNQSGQNVDQDVRDLQNLKPIENGMSVVKSHSSVFTDINGKKEGQYETKEELNKGGKLLARVDQKVKQEDDGSAPTPLTYVRTEVEIPHRGIHKVIESNEQPPQNGLSVGNPNPGSGGLSLGGLANMGSLGNIASTATANKRKMFYPHIESDENRMNFEPYKSYSGVQFSPLDMAEYIFWTGDEKGVTLAIEEFLVEGLMSREEAISYLHDIKSNLEYLQKQYSEEQAQRENSAREQAFTPLRKNLGFLEKAKQARSEANELMEMRQQMRENLNKKSIEPLEPDTNQLKQRILQAGSQGISDEDYEDLLERLRVADFLYTEYSLEEVIYQLAKVMFSQSLTRGSSEAQEALEKFTRFLESEAEMGRISRGLEKKVLDVLIAGLTDTLTEHPELVAVARESLGGIGPSPIDDQLLQQLLILNPSAVDKTESGKNENGMKFSNLKNHRFMMSNKNRISEQLPVPMKKNTIPASSSANQDGKSLHKST